MGGLMRFFLVLIIVEPSSIVHRPGTGYFYDSGLLIGHNLQEFDYRLFVISHKDALVMDPRHKQAKQPLDVVYDYLELTGFAHVCDDWYNPVNAGRSCQLRF